MSVVAKLIQTMNRSLPQRRRSLEELLGEKRASLACRDGTTIYIEQVELEKIAALAEGHEQKQLLLPIIIELTPDFNETSARIRGKIESSLVIKLLGLKKTPADSIVLYMHQIRELRKALPTATQYGYFMSVRSSGLLQ